MEAFVTTSLQSSADRLRSLPGLLVADVGIAHSGADILMPEQLLDFPQIFPHVVEEDHCRGVSQCMGCDLPHPKCSASGPQPQVERPVGKTEPPNIPQTQTVTPQSLFHREAKSAAL
jgi:hypothetical protein